jgi:hypothetical protein
MSTSLKSTLTTVEGEQAILDAQAHEPIYVSGTAEQREKNKAALDLLKTWEAERAAMTPAEIEQAERDWDVFKKSMNENRMSYRMRYVESSHHA